MKLPDTLDARDRKLLLACLAAVTALAFMMGVLARDQNRDDNPMPSSYLTGRHGARAAYDLLAASSYNVTRWEQPLADLAQQADARTVVIFADPLPSSPTDFKAVQEIVHRGGRVLVTGATGGELAPGGAVRPATQFQIASCRLTPEGLDALAGSGRVWMAPAAEWTLGNPLYRVQYDCAGEPAVVEYDQGAGHVVWWASSTPLENGSIGRDGNLALFLNALGPRAERRFYWDESLHGETRSEWFYARGAAMNLLLAGLVTIGMLVVFSFSRRSGPVRDLPTPTRATPVEFLEALGSLYAKAGAAATAVALAYEQFRRRMGELSGFKGQQMSAAELGKLLRRRFPQAGTGLEEDLAACAEAATDEHLAPKRALALVQALHRHGEVVAAAARAEKTMKARRS